MKKVTIYLEEQDIENGSTEFVMQEIGKMIDDGFQRGIKTPKNWTIRDMDPYSLESLKDPKKKILTKQVQSLIEDQELVRQVVDKAIIAYDSGALDTERIKEGDFEIPKLVMIAALQSLAESFTPICQHCQAEIVKLQNII